MKRVYREHFIAFLGFCVLAILVSLPVIFSPRSNIAGAGGDPWQTIWRFEEKSHLLDNSSGFTDTTQRIAEEFFGFGAPHLTNLSVWPWMPLHVLLGQPLAYNVIFLLHFILAGYAMALFIQVLTRSSSILQPAPLLAGIAYMMIPYHVAHSLGHFGAMQLEWIPFIATAAVSFMRSMTIPKAILLGLLLTIQAWTEHHYALWLALWGIFTTIIYRKDLQGVYRSKSIFILVFIIFIGIVLPFIPTFRLATENNDALNLGIQQTIRFSADLFSFITPPPYHPLWGSTFDELFGKYFTGNEAESVQYLGISILLSILFFHRHIPVKQKRLWIGTIILFGLISLGPVLHVFGKETGIPLPYALIANLPIFSAVRVVARAGVMVSFATVVLFGWVIATNSHKPRTSILIGCVLVLEFLFFPFPMQSALLSPVYSVLQNAPGKSVIEIPAATNYVAASRSLYASTFHGKEVLGNIALERGESADVYDGIKSIPAIRQLLYLRTTELMEGRNEFFDQSITETLPDAMNYVGAHAIIVHSDSLSQRQNAAIATVLEKNSDFAKQLFGDATLYILKESAMSHTDGIFLARGNGWENVGYDPKLQHVFAEVPQHAKLSLVNTREHPTLVRLSFSIATTSQSGAILRTATGETIPAERVGNELHYFITIPKGITTISFTPTGSDKLIIQNPGIKNLPFDPAQGKSVDL